MRKQICINDPAPKLGKIHIRPQLGAFWEGEDHLLKYYLRRRKNKTWPLQFSLILMLLNLQEVGSRLQPTASECNEGILI